MPLDAVVEAVLGELLDALDVLGREVGAKLDLHEAALELDHQSIGRISLGRLSERSGAHHGQRQSGGSE